MINALILSNDTDIGRVFEYLFQKMGHVGTHVETTIGLTVKDRIEQIDVVILESVNFLEADDWHVLFELFPRKTNSIPIIITSWFWDEKLESYCNNLKIEDVHIYPFDVPREIRANLKSLFKEETFVAPWRKDNNRFE